MLSLHKVHPPRSVALTPLRHRYGRRNPASSRGLLTGLENQFLDLALALPVPPSWPVYSTAIIAVTVATRLALLPVSIWGKRKSRIIEEVVVPQLEKERHDIAKSVFAKMKADRVTGDKPFLVEYHAKKCRDLLSARQKELFRLHGCQPWKTMVSPPLAQLPAFFAITIGLREIAQMPNTPFDSEAFLTLTTLAHPDPTMTLPIVLGLITMANVETSSLLMTATQKAKFEQIEKKQEAAMKEGKRLIQPGKIVKEALRGLSVVRILVASVMPGSVTLYWLTSATFGLFQTWVMDWIDYRRRKVFEASKVVEQTTTHLKVPSGGLPKGRLVRMPDDFTAPPRR
ncbi:hypothetical protein NMY22_g17248 [Coprinellus aureogranulatus]|nr:hypothetical protein NMY22_g17248 [Coprinellus aureogranulatus]